MQGIAGQMDSRILDALVKKLEANQPTPIIIDGVEYFAVTSDHPLAPLAFHTGRTR